MKKPFVASVTMLVVVTLAATILTGLAPSALSASARQQAQTAAAHQAFDRFMSSHAPALHATGSAAKFASLSNVNEVGSYNWSGFADVPNTSGGGPAVAPTSSVSGNWTIPSVSCLSGTYQNQDLFLAQWVGLDGWNDSTVEQLGTATQCYEGVEYYYVWYEMFPAGTVEMGTTACIQNNTDCPNPGDQIQASVVSTAGSGGNNDYTLKLTDSTNPAESFSISATCAATVCLNSSAEWVVERPAFDLPFGFQILPQADYAQTTFTNGTLTAGHQSTTIDKYAGTVNDIAMVDDSAGYFLSCPGQSGPPGRLLLFPTGCPLAQASHGSFSDTWDSSF